MARRQAGGGITITGDEFIDFAMRELDKRVQKKIVRKATRAAAKVILREARRFAPHDTGELEASLKVRTRKKFPGERRKGIIGHQVVTGHGFVIGDQFYAGFLELGTKERRHASGKSVGQIRKGEHWLLRPAMWGSVNETRSIFRRTMREVLTDAKQIARMQGTKK